jgi:hypothetical protein
VQRLVLGDARASYLIVWHDVTIMQMVEAAGFEPASGHGNSAGPTCLVRSCFLALALATDRLVWASSH